MVLQCLRLTVALWKDFVLAMEEVVRGWERRSVVDQTVATIVHACFDCIDRIAADCKQPDAVRFGRLLLSARAGVIYMFVC